MDATEKHRVAVNDGNSTIEVPHWGITLRTLFGAALASWPNPQPGESREYSVQHKDKTIGAITVRQHNERY